MTETKTEIYVISIWDNPISQYYLNRIRPYWETFGYTLNEFEATTPQTEDFSSTKIRFTDRKFNGHKFTDTEKAVWISHFRLWDLCTNLDRPIHIIEHDTLIFDHIPDFSDEKIALFAWYDEDLSSPYEGIDRVVAPCAGYYISPEAAQRLKWWALKEEVNHNVEWLVHRMFDFYHPVTQNDCHIFQQVIYPMVVAEQIKDPEVGTTIEHNLDKVYK